MAKEDKGSVEQPERPPELTPEMIAQLTQMRSALRENVGAVVLALAMLPRYRSQMLSDLTHLVIEPMLSDRVAMAYPGEEGKEAGADIAGFAFWASVSEEVDARIREQVSAKVFPVRLKREDWNSGDINWLLDVVAPDPKTTANVIANFRKVAKGGELRLHPMVSQLLDAETLEKMGARRGAPKGSSEE